jgi:hypothetical protein
VDRARAVPHSVGPVLRIEGRIAPDRDRRMGLGDLAASTRIHCWCAPGNADRLVITRAGRRARSRRRRRRGSNDEIARHPCRARALDLACAGAALAAAEANRPGRLVPARLPRVGLVLRPEPRRAGRDRQAEQRQLPMGLDLVRIVLSAQRQRPTIKRRWQKTSPASAPGFFFARLAHQRGGTRGCSSRRSSRSISFWQAASRPGGASRHARSTISGAGIGVGMVLR